MTTAGIIKLMLTVTQILLVVAIVILSGLLTLVGVQVYQVLREIKKSTQLFNEILSNAAQASRALSQPIVNIASLISSLKAIFGKLVKEQNGRKKEK